MSSTNSLWWGRVGVLYDVGIVYGIGGVGVVYGGEGGVGIVNDVICRAEVGNEIKGEVRVGVLYTFAWVIGVVYGIWECLGVCL